MKPHWTWWAAGVIAICVGAGALRSESENPPIRASDSGIPQGPCDGHLARRRVLALPHGAQYFYQPQIP